MNKRFIQLIIPCWNSATTVSNMIDSILEQTCKDFFIVLVDDMSTDNTYEVLKSYENRFPDFIKAVKVPYKMYADGARKYGFDQKVNAEFTWFVDSDDSLYDDSVVEKLKEIHQKNMKSMYIVNFNTLKFQRGKIWFGGQFRIVKTEKVVFDVLGVPYYNDVLQTWKQFDSIPDDEIMITDLVAYNYSGSHFEKNVTQATDAIVDKFNRLKEILDGYEWKKDYMKQLWLKTHERKQ